MKQAQALAPWMSSNMFYRGGDRNSQFSSYQLNPLLQQGESMGIIAERNQDEKLVTSQGFSLSTTNESKLFLAWLHALAWQLCYLCSVL